MSWSDCLIAILGTKLFYWFCFNRRASWKPLVDLLLSRTINVNFCSQQVYIHTYIYVKHLQNILFALWTSFFCRLWYVFMFFNRWFGQNWTATEFRCCFNRKKKKNKLWAFTCEGSWVKQRCGLGSYRLNESIVGFDFLCIWQWEVTEIEI